MVAWRRFLLMAFVFLFPWNAVMTDYNGTLFLSVEVTTDEAHPKEKNNKANKKWSCHDKLNGWKGPPSHDTCVKNSWTRFGYWRASFIPQCFFFFFWQVKVQGQNEEMLLAACEQFLGKAEQEIRRVALETLGEIFSLMKLLLSNGGTHLIF